MSFIIDFIVNFITNYADTVIIGFSAGGIGYFSMPILKAKIKKDGFQTSDITEAVSEGTTEYQSVMSVIETVIDDVTVNDADTISFIKNSIKDLKKFK
ncbi:MAG: hypothetical protein WCR19_03920 [Acholeplasmataceae bacterium]